MPTEVKAGKVAALREGFENSEAALLAEYTGLKVSEMQELRVALAESGANFKVVKNTLTRLAAQQANLEELLPFLQGSTAVAFVTGDPVAAAKSLQSIAGQYPALVIKGGILDGKVLTAEQARGLANVKPKEVLMAQLAGLLQMPIQQTVNVLSAPLRQLANVLSAYRDKAAAEGPAEPEPEPEPEQPAEPEPEPEPEQPAEPEPEPEQPAEPEAQPAEPEAQPEIPTAGQDDQPSGEETASGENTESTNSTETKEEN